jgi:hypothetical protein
MNNWIEIYNKSPYCDIIHFGFLMALKNAVEIIIVLLDGIEMLFSGRQLSICVNPLI